MKKLVDVRVSDFWLIDGVLMIRLEIKVPGHGTKSKTINYSIAKNVK